MPIWFCISEEARQGLKALQNELYPYIPLRLPVYEEILIAWDGKLETREEISRFMKIGARYGRLPRHLR